MQNPHHVAIQLIRKKTRRHSHSYFVALSLLDSERIFSFLTFLENSLEIRKVSMGMVKEEKE